jgi:endoribonuclease Dicer
LVKEGIVALDSASLVIFDEAHHIQKDHPFNVFLRDFLLPMEQESRPMVRFFVIVLLVCQNALLREN